MGEKKGKEIMWDQQSCLQVWNLSNKNNLKMIQILSFPFFKI